MAKESDEETGQESSPPAAVNRSVANGGNAAVAERRDRRADDVPAWFQKWQKEHELPDEDEDEEGDEDGILSIEELPDLLDDAGEKVKEIAESIPERVPFLFRTWFKKSPSK